MRIPVNGLEFEVESQGDVSRTAVLLVMGLGMQMIAWPDAFIRELLDAGYRVVRFDNRDVGLSSKMESAGKPNLVWAMARRFMHLQVHAPYSLDDMARDSIGIMDALGIARAHVVGVSMGGMIAQLMAAHFPDRLLSLTSIMSSTGARHLPEARPHVMRALLSRPADSSSLQGRVDHYVKLFRIIGSPGFPTPEDVSRPRLEASLQRSYYPVGTARQMLAIAASGDRSPQLQKITTPTLVIHGTDDALVPVEAGKDTAAKIRGAKLTLIPGMGHDLAPGLVPLLTAALVAHFASSAA